MKLLVKELELHIKFFSTVQPVPCVAPAYSPPAPAPYSPPQPSYHAPAPQQYRHFSESDSAESDEHETIGSASERKDW